MDSDIRWKQRFSNYQKAFGKLEHFITYIGLGIAEKKTEEKESSDAVFGDLIKQGVIQSFEYTHELAWNVMKDYAEYQGNAHIHGSREAFKMGLVSDGEVWMEMIKSRNAASHTYDDDTTAEIFTKIIKEYFPVFTDFRDQMKRIQKKNE
ncbi:MAG: nucleotidyltransferase substrate binding protein [Spirochaetaceae bacterium]|jgi:nucleotidyltransferase substrate binding protein (TIGR01987 family)|nr:nucleotidyltransferase substrate binding protein [Spirochaetaceae bacterium]